jgi:phosphatidylinositol-3-phosphatase
MRIRGPFGTYGRLAVVAALLPVSLALSGTAGATTSAVAMTGASGAATPARAAGHAFRPPPIRHVWIIELENEGYTQSFGDPTADPYLARTLPAMGALLKGYFAVGHDSLDNYIAQISGQAPDPATMNDCGVWTKFAPAIVVRKPFHQLVGNGCVYPKSVPTLGNQLSGKHLTWKAYLQDMGNDPVRDSTVKTGQGPACGHPAVGSPDPTEGAEAADQFADRHEGFMYFESVIGTQAFCDAHILSFQPLLKDLRKVSTTPNFSWLSPNLCNDGHDAPCADGDPGGLDQVNGFLHIWVPEILNSPAYKKNGLLIITFDEGSTSQACCGETTGKSASHPNTARPGMNGPGGGRVGAVLLSPFIRPGTVSTVLYNHYSFLRSVEDLFGLAHLGDAAMPQVRPFGRDVYTRP